MLKTLSRKLHLATIGHFLLSIGGPLAFGFSALALASAFFLQAHQAVAEPGVAFAQGPLWPLFGFTILLIVILTLLFASLQAHAYWVRLQERVSVEKSSFVRMASDTLRTPLTGLRWTTELMLSGEFGQISKEQEESITSMDTAIGRVIDLVNELLEVMRLSGGIINYQPAPTDVEKLVQGAVKDMKDLAGTKRIQLGFGQISHDLIIEMDSPLIRHVLSTLLAGAIHLARSKSIIVIHTEPTEERIAIGITYEGEAIQMKNFDSTEKSIQRAALPINLGKLDLAISWEILNAAEGEFWRVDKEDTHTLFIGLPLEISRRKPAPAVAAPALKTPTNKTVEDVSKFVS